MLRSGTLVSANVGESVNVGLNLDFTHKSAIAQKEFDETHYGLELHFLLTF